MHRTLRHYFRTQRKRHGLGQKQMARLLGKSRAYVSDLENGKCDPSLETVLIYHLLFGVEVAELIPEFYQNVHTLLVRRINSQPHLVSDNRSLRSIKKRLKMMASVHTDNKQKHESKA